MSLYFQIKQFRVVSSVTTEVIWQIQVSFIGSLMPRHARFVTLSRAPFPLMRDVIIGWLRKLNGPIRSKYFPFTCTFRTRKGGTCTT